MTRKGKIILAGAAAATMGLAAAGAIAARGDWHGGGHWGHGAHRGHAMGMSGLSLGIGSPIRRLCRGDAGEMTDHMLVRIEHKVKPTDAQKAPFEEFKTAARAAAAKIEAACPTKPEDDKADEPRSRPSPVERLARTQAELEASLDALKTVRPAAEKFYASLNDEQKAKFNTRRWRDKRGERNSGAADEADGKTAPEDPAKQ